MIELIAPYDNLRTYFQYYRRIADKISALVNPYKTDWENIPYSKECVDEIVKAVNDLDLEAVNLWFIRYKHLVDRAKANVRITK